MLEQLSRKRLLNLGTPKSPPSKVARTSNDPSELLQNLPMGTKLTRAQFEELIRFHGSGLSSRDVDSSPSISISSRESQSKQFLSRSPSPQQKVREGKLLAVLLSRSAEV